MIELAKANFAYRHDNLEFTSGRWCSGFMGTLEDFPCCLWTLPESRAQCCLRLLKRLNPGGRGLVIFRMFANFWGWPAGTVDPHMNLWCSPDRLRATVGRWSSDAQKIKQAVNFYLIFPENLSHQFVIGTIGKWVNQSCSSFLEIRAQQLNQVGGYNGIIVSRIAQFTKRFSLKWISVAGAVTFVSSCLATWKHRFWQGH